MDLISVIIPMYNASKYIERCLKSIIEQTYKTLEIIVIDDGSTDNSTDIIKEFLKIDKRIKIIQKKNSGVSDSRNFGIDNAQGEWICFVDSDDYIEKDYIETLYNYSIKNEVDIIYSGIRMINGTEVTLKTNNCGKKILEKHDIKDLMCSLIDNCTLEESNIDLQVLGYPFAKLLKKSIVKDIRFEREISIREDALFNMDVLDNAHRILLVEYAGYNYIIHPNSAMEKFHSNYDKEVFIYLEKCKIRCERYNLGNEPYNIAVLYAYMMWIKLFLMHKKSYIDKIKKIEILKKSFSNQVWYDAFYNVNENKLKFQYKLLRKFYINKSYRGIKILYTLSRLRK
ncbi:glycosyltransferase family 2 protein [uncultured Clostridium sp.]|uniref:glycosyltransferase family 2 protein n=1 Tax=uncultured Clostridium sp. TaxID=59620 RepID=UPI0025F8A653|nr:glycosyltransferase family 2 protein [uncultured Clostridium sp.]MDU4884833.1 glycosyltransferase family 2 protein [Clostridium celatum]MDU7078060.1 glycosyltransferase family 2 protein [Clostridium celatum]